MQVTAIIVWVYGALVLAGGVMGRVKARSKPSLIAGAVFGMLLLVLGFQVWINRRAGLIGAVMAAAALLAIFSMRFATTKKFMPAGLMMALSALAAIVFGMCLM